MIIVAGRHTLSHAVNTFKVFLGKRTKHFYKWKEKKKISENLRQ